MKLSSWTRAAPFKEERHHRSPSESIANNYTPTASNLKLKNLRKRKSLCKILLPLKSVLEYFIFSSYETEFFVPSTYEEDLFTNPSRLPHA